MKKLVVYFSASGVTAKKAKELAAAIGADAMAIEPKEPYTAADLDWRNKKSRSSVEMQNPASRPAIKKNEDISGYDRIYIGYPIWWGVAPRAVNTFIESNNLDGKEIVIFATSGGSGIDYAINDMKKNYPALNIIGGKLLNGKVEGDII